MSWANSRRYNRGDPGLFDFIGKAIGGVANLATGGAAGAIYSGIKAIAGIAGGGKRPAPAGPVSPIQLGNLFSTPIRSSSTALIQAPRTPTLMPTPVVMPGGAVVVPDSVKVSGTNIAGLYQSGQATAYFSQPQPGAAAGMVCGSNGKMRAAHLNRSGYHLKNGTYVAPGTKCVANRRRNPLNPRALSRAMSRVAGAQKAIKSIIRFERVASGGKINAGRRRKR
jgi:hypothetical protein